VPYQGAAPVSPQSVPTASLISTVAAVANVPFRRNGHWQPGISDGDWSERAQGTVEQAAEDDRLACAVSVYPVVKGELGWLRAVEKLRSMRTARLEQPSAHRPCHEDEEGLPI
jgi:hypothetical protein